MNTIAKKRVLNHLWRPAAVLMVLLPLSFAFSAYSQGFTGVVIFGDSLSDPGNHFIEFGTTSRQPFAPIPDASYAIGGHHFSDGATWAEQVATALHMPNSGSPALRAPGVFTNYAVGRARARQCTTVPAACPAGQYPFGVVDLNFEVSHFLSDFPAGAPPADLYVMWIGNNDLDDALTALQTDSTGATSIAIILTAVASEAANIRALYAAGARTFFIPTVANLAFTPFVRSLGPGAQFVATQFAAIYNGALDQVQAAFAAQLPGILFIPFDVNALLAQIVAQPGAFGIANALDPCLTFGVVGNAICATPNGFLFWDGIHPTRKGHSLLAAGVLQTLGQ